jgi:tetraacyldisaccharide 4'-kinase
MRAPAFWQHDGVLPALLAPLARVVAAATARRVARPGWHAPVPVVCCGNAGVGGTGKTTLALDLGARLLAHGHAVAFLTRGYGGRSSGVWRVDPARDGAAEVGDESLLLAAVDPTYVAADRAAGARAAIAAGATVLVMDDGLQNPTLAKSVSLLVIDGAAGFGNGRVLPAGPLREPAAVAAARCRAAVLIGADERGAARQLPAGLPVLRASLRPAAEVAGFAGRRALAYAGIGRPEKFFAMLEAAGVILAARVPFADHYRYTPADLARLHAQAAKLGAVPVTTPKDAARLPAGDRAKVSVIGVRLAWDDDAAIERLLTGLR